MTRYGFILALVFAPACAAPSNTNTAETTVEADSVKPSDAGWYLARKDTRTCTSAVGCGGYYVKRANLAKTICFDGTSKSECYVQALDWSATQFSSDEQTKIAASPVVFHGRLIDGHYSTRTEYANLSIADVWSPAVTPSTDRNGYITFDYALYHTYANNIRCIKAPCPTTTQDLLNSSSTQNITGVDLSTTGANDKQVVEGSDALATTGGILADGIDVSIANPKGSIAHLSATNFYLEVQPAPTTVSCGGIAAIACPAAQWCDVDVASACGGADLGGTCKDVPQLCNHIYLPVCGCDGNTYSNDCFRVMAKVQLDHTGECAAQ